MTKRVHLLGHPVSHSVSPILQNAAFKALGLDWEYTAWDLEPAELIERLERLEANPNVVGCNVTVPHKLAVFEWLQATGRSIHPGAAQAHAVNTLFRDPAGKFCGDSTDAMGGLVAIGHETKSQGLPDLTGRDVAILGTGGSASSFGFLLGKAPRGATSVSIFGRSTTKASDLADRINSWERLDGQLEVQAHPLHEFSRWNRNRHSLIIQTTTVGMDSGPDPRHSPVPDDAIGEGQIAFDLVYKPHQTTFLKDAAFNGATTVHGIYMLIGQGVLALELWLKASGSPTDHGLDLTKVMEQALRDNRVL